MRTRSTLLPAALTVALLTGLVLAPASAAEADDVAFNFDPPADMTVTYGQGWYFPFTAPYMFDNGFPVTGEVAGPFEGPISNFIIGGLFGQARGYISLPQDQPPTPVGEYQVYATLRTTDYGSTQWVATPTAPAHLVVKPATMKIVQKVVADPNAPNNVIVSASMTGDFIDNYGWTTTAPADSLTANMPRIPSGSWSIRITDGDKAVLERKIDQPTGGPVDISFYWNTAPLNAQLTSTITFTPTSSAVGNFDVTQPAPFSFTSAEDGRPVPVADPSGTDQNVVASHSGPSFPLWAVLLTGLLGLGLAAAIVGLSISARRRRAAVAGIDGDEPIPPDEQSALEAPSTSDDQLTLDAAESTTTEDEVTQ